MTGHLTHIEFPSCSSHVDFAIITVHNCIAKRGITLDSNPYHGVKNYVWIQVLSIGKASVQILNCTWSRKTDELLWHRNSTIIILTRFPIMHLSLHSYNTDIIRAPEARHSPTQHAFNPACHQLACLWRRLIALRFITLSCIGVKRFPLLWRHQLNIN